LADPWSRAERSARIAATTRAEVESLGAVFGLTPDQINQIGELTIRTQLQVDQRMNECQLEPGCDAVALYRELESLQAGEMVNIVGARQQARMQIYDEAHAERFAAQNLQALPYGRNLTDVQAGQLVLAMAEERQLFVVDAGIARGKVDTFESRTFPPVEIRSVVLPGATDGIEERLASAAEYNERVYRRAATIIDGDLLAKLRSVQQVALDNYRQELEERRIRESVQSRNGMPE
jgi:hypothetical protein